MSDLDQDTTASEEGGGGRGGRRVSLWWLFAILPFLTFSLWTVMAPRIEVYTSLVCKVIRPDYPDTMHIRYRSGKEPSRNSCATDPVVQAGVSKLIAVLTFSSGIVSCVTASWWGSFSDRHGRKFVLGLSVLGLALGHMNMIFVSLFVTRLPGNYWFLMVGSFIEGLFGGATAVSAAIESYVVDCAEASSRSRMFSIAGGLLSIGGFLGPLIGGLLIHAFHNVLTAFYGAVVLLLCFVFVVFLLLPESLSQEQQLANKHAYAARQRSGSGWGKVLAPIAPLSIFLPTKCEAGPGTSRSRTDWNLTWVAITYGTAIMVLTPLDYVFQYTSYAFGWTAETVSYYLTLHGITKAIFLSLILPACIKWLKPNNSAVRIVETPSESSPLVAPLNEDVDLNSLSPLSHSHSHSHEKDHPATFDLKLARVSLLIHMASFAFCGLVPLPWVFTAASILGQFGSGFSPGLHSVAMEVYMQRIRRSRGASGVIPVEVGKLFGSLSVVQALCAQMLGPGLLAVVFMCTVASVPSAVFLFAGLAILFSTFLLGFVQLNGKSNGVQGHDRGDLTEDFVGQFIDDQSLQ